MMAFSSTKTTKNGANFLAFRTQVVGQLPLYSVVPFVVVGAGFLSVASRPMGYDLDGSVHYGAGVKVPLQKLLGLRFDFRDNMTQKLFVAGESSQSLVHNVELQLSATVTLGRKAPLAASDSDFDGLLDVEDVCPDVGAFTYDGCPVDRDNDGVIDIVDECPLQAGPEPKGCPEAPPSVEALKDEDNDGIETPLDECPKVPETINGIDDTDGCPDDIPEALESLLGPARGIMFEAKGARIFDTSLVTLDELALALTTYSEVRIEVTGHTSAEGELDENQRLSMDRAKQVKGALVERGVASDRINTGGVGSDEPVADNATDEGRAENERVDIRILSGN
jgi:outer membrane protein OmpA-like peptidoglycan-associated protein